jgi:AcrR family transcriptional regulator
MPRTSDARAKALATAERLFRVQGLAATGLAQIIAESGSPKGSFYFHFPGGKDQLAAEVAAGFAARGLAAIQQVAAGTPGDAAGFVSRLCAAFAREMRASGFTLGCALQNIAVEKAPADAALTALLVDGLGRWIDAIAAHLDSCGTPRAGEAALALVAALEGARTLARVQQSDAVYTAIAQNFTANWIIGER